MKFDNLQAQAAYDELEDRANILLNTTIESSFMQRHQAYYDALSRAMEIALGYQVKMSRVLAVRETQERPKYMVDGKITCVAYNQGMCPKAHLMRDDKPNE